MIDFRKLQAVIWDMDGVLVDSEPVHMEAWHRTCEKFHLQVSRERLKRTFGMTSEMVLRFALDEPLIEERMTEIIAEKNRVFQSLIVHQAKMPTGVMGWLNSFKKNGIHQGLASSGIPENITLILETLGIASFFDEIVSGRDIPSKPEPLIFIKAANLLGVVPPNCLVIEDSTAGVQAAKAAGMRCAAVAGSNPPEILEGADIIVENLSQLMIEEIQTLFPN